MESILNRYRNLTVLLVVIVAQLLLIAYQVKTNKDVPLIRVWAVTAVTPIERLLEVVRRNTWVFVEDYFVLLHTRTENEKLRSEVGRVKLENHYLKSQLATADRAHALSVFQAQAPSKTVAARIIGNGTGANSKIVFVDRGSGVGIQAGMAVVTPDGIIGKVVRAYPTASLIQMMTDGNFAAGVVSQNNLVRGTMKGQGHDGSVMVDYVQNEQHVDVGEWFYTSGDDRIFPKGFPVGQASAVRNGRLEKEIYVTPSGFQNGLEEVLIVLNGVHQDIPETQVASPGYKMLLPPQETNPAGSGLPAQPSAPNTDADRLKEQYRQLGAEEKHTYGEGGFDKPPDFTRLPPLRGSAVSRSNEPKKDGAAAHKPAQEASSGSSTLPGKPAVVTSRGAPAGSGSTKPVTPKLDSANQATTAAPPVAKPKPRTAGPLLVTDPADADPTEPAPQLPSSRPDRTTRPVELNEMGEPKVPRAVPHRVRPGDGAPTPGNVTPKAPPAPDRP